MANKPPFRLINKDPITSYGILLFHCDSEGELWYLLAQRRDSIEYTDYLRGRYSYPNLELYLSLMTQDERERLKAYTFDELWKDLWINYENKFYRDQYDKAKAKFEANKEYLLELLDKTTSSVKEPGWGFPKGKKNNHENEVSCSIREFEEETRLTLNYVNLLNLPPHKEVFKGSNGRMYATVYYIANTDTKSTVEKLSVNGIRTETVSEEISNLAWLRLEDAIRLLPKWRQKLLKAADRKIKEYYKDQ